MIWSPPNLPFQGKSQDALESILDLFIVLLKTRLLHYVFQGQNLPGESSKSFQLFSKWSLSEKRVNKKTLGPGMC